MGHEQDHRRRPRPAAGPRLQRLSPQPPRPGAARLVEVAPERLDGWVERFCAAHGPCATEVADGSVRLVAADSARAELEVPWPPLPAAGPGEGPVAVLARHAGTPRTALLLLVRRGGAAVGLARDGALLDHTSASRHVQARTAAGGWSQQRYARRRAGQAAQLVGSVADAAVRVLGRAASAAPPPPEPEVLVVGGDRALVDAVLEDPRLGRAAALPRSPLLAVPDPRLEVLAEAARRARAVRIRVTGAAP